MVAQNPPSTIYLEPTSPEQRRSYYKDIEALISPGFLTQSVQIGDVDLSFRSLTDSDLFMIRCRCGQGAGDFSRIVWVLASSIWLLQGWNLLEESNMVPRLAKTLRALPKPTLYRLFSVVSNLSDRQNKAHQGVEAYSYERTSRYLWKTSGRAVPSEAVRGIPGVDRIGLTPVQKMWVASNLMEDDRVQNNRDWGHAKFIASATNPKGVKNISHADEMAEQEELRRRQEVQDRWYYVVAGLLTEEQAETAFSRSDRPRGKSFDELEAEMKRWVAGEMDEHDMIVAQYKQRITDRMMEEQQKREAQIAQLRALEAEADKNAVILPTRLVGYTPGELEGILGKENMESRTTRVYEGHGWDPQDPVYRKYLVGRPAAPKGLRVVDGELVDEGEQDLNAKIEARQVSVRDGL